MFPHRHKIGGDDGLEQMLHFLSSTNSSPNMPLSIHPMERSSNSRWKPNIEIAPNCPRCASTNTKFCYYNNYSLSQPRYFCKGCRRYWTKGGSIRNVPVGGGCRKTRRGKSARNPQSDRLSSNNFNDSEDGGDGHQQNQTNGSRDIDMALVFAKFLNQNPSSGDEFESEANNGSSSSNNNINNNMSTPESVEIETENDAVVVQPQQKRSDIADALLVGGGDPLEEMRVDHQVQNFGGEELISLSGMDEFEGFLGVDGDVVHDVLWYDDAIVPSSNTWQLQPPPNPMMQMHEFPGELEYSMPLNEDGNELLPVSSSSTSTVNLICESWSSWSSFDLSTMEVFSSSSTP